jgi:protein TonB
MTALVLSHTASAPWSWPRVGAWSGALSLHVAALLLLLVPPAAMTLLPPVREITYARVLDPPPPTKSEESPLPKPPVRALEVRPKPPQARTPVQPPVAPPTADSTMHSQVADASPRAIDDATSAPVDGEPTALAYHTRTKIPYPREAFQSRQEGTVILRVLVGTDGIPQAVEIEKSSGSRSLDTAARDAVRKWTFQAGTRNGIATPLWARVPVTFSLQIL